MYINIIREIAINNKYTKYYCNIIIKALARPQNKKVLNKNIGYVESHHILPKSFKLGGETDKNNLVFLTAKEHFIVHLCATKMFKSVLKNKMIFAFRQLKCSNKHQNRKINSRLYSKIKPDSKLFVRLYKLDKVKYIYKNQAEEIERYKIEGWTIQVTTEFRRRWIGVGTGRVVSEETRKKLSIASKTRIRPKGRKQTKESIEKAIQTKKRIKLNNPEKYQLSIDSRVQSRRKSYKLGLFNMSGSKNGMYGKTHSEESKKNLSEIKKRTWAKLKENPEEYEKKRKEISVTRKKQWENNTKLKERASITGTTAYRKYKMSPQDFYEQKVKPLIYLGFLPTSMVKYKLLDMSIGYISKFIYAWGSQDDIIKFKENKNKMAGSNKSYREFLENQYNKYFKTSP